MKNSINDKSMKEGFYKTLLDNASDLIWAIDMEGRFMYINDNIKEWGYDKDELIGQPLVNILNTKRIGKRESALTMQGVLQSFEMEIMDKRGQNHKVIVKSSPLHGDNGKVVGVMGIIHDVTEMQLLEEKLKNEERMASLGRLATGIAHEIRNPLSSVKMNIAILKERLEPKGEDVEHFEIAEEEVDNLERIMSELLDYAKPMKLEIARVELGKVIDRVMATVKTACDDNNITVNTKLDEKTPHVPMDETKIYQALLNILLNAVQASDNGASINITTKYIKSLSEKVRITIADQGQGIEADDLKYIFDPFFTTKKSGSGLGLSIVRNIIGNHGGVIDIESEIGKGASVIIYLPLG